VFSSISIYSYINIAQAVFIAYLGRAFLAKVGTLGGPDEEPPEFRASSAASCSAFNCSERSLK
jgi:hypothetical protein